MAVWECDLWLSTQGAASPQAIDAIAREIDSLGDRIDTDESASRSWQRREGHVVHLDMSGDGTLELMLRVDLRVPWEGHPLLAATCCAMARRNNLEITDVEGRTIPAIDDELMDVIRSSGAAEFVRDPNRFTEALGGDGQRPEPPRR